MNRLVVALKGLAELAFLEVYGTEVAPRDFVLRIQSDRVLVAPQGFVDSAEVLHRHAARCPGVRRPSDHANRALVANEGFLMTALFDEAVSLWDLAVRQVEEDEGRNHPDGGNCREHDRGQGIRGIEQALVHPKPDQGRDETPA